MPTRSRPSSNCGFTSKKLAILADAAGDCSEHLRDRDERDVNRREVGREGQLVGTEVARVAALDHLDPRVVAQAPVELARGDVERDDALRAVLQQAVGEPAGRGADVEAAEPADIDSEHIERVLELDAAAGDVGRWLGDRQLGVLGDELAGLGRRPSRPMRTRPARTDSAALVREPTSPRSASSASIRRFGIGAR